MYSRLSNYPTKLLQLIDDYTSIFSVGQQKHPRITEKSVVSLFTDKQGNAIVPYPALNQSSYT